MIKNINRSLSYRVLELEGPASEEEIKKTYRRLVKEWHPDRNPDNPSAEERFKEIQQAYDFLIKEKTNPDQNIDNQFDNGYVSSVHDHPFQSLREAVIKYYADRGWFKK